jgi:hypothetical protein
MVSGGAGPNSCDPQVAPRARASLTSFSARLARLCDAEKLAGLREFVAGACQVALGAAGDGAACGEASTSQVSAPRV